MSMIERPGVMIYFDVMPLVEFLSDADAGRLFKAILEYGRTGVAPGELSPTAEVAWKMMKPRIDRDAEKYVEKVQGSIKANKVKFLRGQISDWDKVSPKTQAILLDCTTQDKDGHFILDREKLRASGLN